MHLFNDNILDINTLLQDFATNKPLQILHQDKFINKRGDLVTDSGSIYYNVSTPISIKANEGIKIVARGYLNNVSVLSQYIDDTTFKPLVISTDNETHEFTFTATEDMNVVVCSHREVDWQFVHFKDTLKVYDTLNKLKVDYKGNVHDSVPNAIHKPMEDLNDKLNCFSLHFTYTTGAYINYANGKVASHTNNLSATDFIDIEDVTNLNIFNLNYRSKDSGGLAFYNESKLFIQGHQYNKDVNLSIKVPKNAKYVRLTIPTDSLGNVFITPNVVGMINELKQEMEEATGSESLVYEPILKEGYYINYSNGAEAVFTSNGLSASDFVELNRQHTKLYVDNLNYPSSDLGGLAFYDNNKKFIKGHQYNKASNLCLDLPSNACYVRLTTLTSSPVTVYSKCILKDLANKNSEQIQNLEETISALNLTDNYDYCQIFHKIAGIGDSLMSGELAFWSEEEQKNKYVDLYKYSWLSNLCKNIGAEPVHYSSGGRTTKTWLSGFLDSLKSDPVKPSAYFIALGTNDTRYVELGTIEDCDTDNETFYGMYSKIIKEVQQFNPHAKIFCCSLYFNPSSETVQNYCNAIRTMSERYGCYYVDFLNAYGHTYSTTNKHFVSVGHFTAPGYVRVGKEMQMLVNDIIRKNQNDFKFIGLNHKDI